jgi:hypothetical protein
VAHERVNGLTFVELMFDIGPVTVLVESVPAGVPAGDDLVPVLPALRPVIPGGGLRPGWVVSVGGSGAGAPGAASLGLALIAGAAGNGGWCAAVGLPDLGLVAAAGMGAEPERLLLVDDPGDRWPDVVAALIDAVDLVLVRPRARAGPSSTLTRRLAALARRGRCVLVADGDWGGAQLRLGVAAADWTGPGAGAGHLTSRRAHVVATGKGAAGPGRSAWIWLPGPDGAVAPAAAPAAGRPTLEVVA